MKAMILAAGLGSRLGKITSNTPKCLVEAGGRALLDYTVENLKSVGVTSIAINLFYLGSQIESYVRSQNDFGIKFEFIHESELLGTGGGVLNARRFFEGAKFFFVHNSDIYTEFNLKPLVNFHAVGDQIASLAILPRASDRSLLLDKDELIGWSSPTASSIVRDCDDPKAVDFSGIQIVSTEIFRYMNDEPKLFSIINAYVNAVKAGKRVRAFSMADSYWIDAGTPERLAQLRGRLEEVGSSCKA
jgi:NDP-sugar pyrophosphorylase family protein